jgi:hypothetical protein
MRERITMRRSLRNCSIRTMKRRMRLLRRLHHPRKLRRNRMKMMSMPRMMTTSTKKKCSTSQSVAL